MSGELKKPENRSQKRGKNEREKKERGDELGGHRLSRWRVPVGGLVERESGGEPLHTVVCDVDGCVCRPSTDI